jgi:hypothetical protein
MVTFGAPNKYLQFLTYFQEFHNERGNVTSLLHEFLLVCMTLGHHIVRYFAYHINLILLDKMLGKH